MSRDPSLIDHSYTTSIPEAPSADKDVDHVVAVVDRAGIARRVARLVPIGVVKG